MNSAPSNLRCGSHWYGLCMAAGNVYGQPCDVTSVMHHRQSFMKATALHLSFGIWWEQRAHAWHPH